MPKPLKITLIIFAVILAFLVCLFFFLFYNFNQQATLEIERKYLLDRDNLPIDTSQALSHYYHIDQTYLSFEPEIRLRKIDDWADDTNYNMGIKMSTAKSNLIRQELEIPITQTLYQLLLSFQRGETIKKTRYSFSAADGHIYEIDVFHDQLDGLVYFETEFDDEQTWQNFSPPSWVVRDVTEEAPYKNASLAQHGLPADFSP